MTSPDLVVRAESSIRSSTGIAWESHFGTPSAFRPYDPHAGEQLLASCDAVPATATSAKPAPPEHPAYTRNAIYTYDGTLEGMFAAMHAAFQARDAEAEILEASCTQPRFGQEVIDVPSELENALKVRRLVEYSLGVQGFHCIRTAASSDDAARGTTVYRFIRHALAASGRTRCTRCEKKCDCTHACERPKSCPILDDLAQPAVFALLQLYRAVMNERHHMLEFMRFEHCEGDVWFARCNPKANVVPLLMDWFIARFNDQRFVIYDENHAMSGVYDGTRWYLVGGSDITPPPQMEDEALMQEAWRRFYRSISVEARYNPELRRNFMPMRFWVNLPEFG